jgi:hypothetical protein
MDFKTTVPKTHAGTERPLTISGGTGPKRADRKSGKYARGGRVKKGGHTTNVIIANPGAGAAAAAPPRPVPIPVPVQQPSAPIPPRPVVAAPVAAAPVGAAPPVLPAGARPPGLKTGGVVKKASGGFLKNSPGKTYTGFPHSPTSDVDDAVSAQKRGGAVKKAKGGAVEDEESEAEEADEDNDDRDSKTGVSNYKKGGKVAKRYLGGPGGTLLPGQNTGGMGGPMLAPGMSGIGYKKGGSKKANGGGVDEPKAAQEAREAAAKTMRKSRSMPDAFPVGGMPDRKRGGAVMKAGSGAGLGRLKESKVAARVPAKTEE